MTRKGGVWMNRVAVALLVLGVLVVSFGAWLVLPAAGFIVAGVLLLDVQGERR